MLLLMSGVNWAQDAVHEEPRIFGECLPHYASGQDSLFLYNLPNKKSQTKIIPYGVDWKIPFSLKDGLTRVISVGKLKTKEQALATQCEPTLPDNERVIYKNEIVDYLYYTSEGYGRVSIKGSQCEVPVDEGFGLFEVITFPEVQVWQRVLFKDGSSPGWLLLDGSQTKVSGIEC